MLVLVYPFYAFALTMMIGPMGMFTAFASVMHLSRKMIIFFLNAVLIDRVQKVIFDAVLSREGLYDVVFNYNIRNETKSQVFDIQKIILGKFIPFILSECVVFMILCVPLIGPLLVLLVRAPKKAFNVHQRYFKLMAFDYKAQNLFYTKFKSDYRKIGIMMYLLEMIPCMTIFFLFTNNIGMALWTVDKHEAFIESSRVETVSETSLSEEVGDDIVNQIPSTPTGRCKRRPSLKLLPFIVKSRKRSNGKAGFSQEIEPIEAEEIAQESRSCSLTHAS